VPLTGIINEPCTVTGASSTSVGAGGGTSHTAGSAQDALCKHRPVKEDERIIEDRTVTELLVHLTPTDVTVTASSTFTVNGQDYSVVGQPAIVGNDTLGRYWKFQAAEVRGV
jgi:hypothetical protein